MATVADSATATASGNAVLKTAITVAAGSTTEWYDFFVYSTAAALVFPRLFFPHDLSPFVAQIAAFSTFAVGFISRPFGGLLFGHFGDLFGRKIALVVALVSMGLGTALIGLLPTYATAGATAPLLLVLLRFIQGLALGGQWGGATLLAVESAPPRLRGYYGSFVQTGVPIGVVLANVVFIVAGAVMSPSAFESWGWRVPFLFSIVLVIIGFYIQFRLEESLEFRETRKERAKPAKAPRSPVFQAVLQHPGHIVLAGGAFIANCVCFYIAISYSMAYGTATLHISKFVILAAVMISNFLMMPILVFSGWLSDLFGRLGIFLIGAVLTGLWAFEFFPLLETGSTWLIIADITIEMGVISLMYGPQAALFAELFPVELRYSGASIGYQLGAVVGGGFAPIIATALYEQYQTSFAVACYMAAMCAVTFVCTLILVFTKKT